MTRIRVLYVCSTLRRTGPTNQLYYLVRNIDPARFEFRILTLSPEPAESAWGELEQYAPIESLGLSRIEGVVKGGARLKAYAATYAPDVVHTQGIRADSLSARHLVGIARVATLRNYPYDDYPMKFGGVRGRWMAARHLAALKKVERVVACSGFIANAVRRYGIEAKVVQNGVDTMRFSPATPEERLELRRRLAIGEGERVAISVGSLIERKRPVDVVKGFLEAAAGGKIDRLLMLGDGPLMEECRSAAVGDKRVEFLGFRSNVVDYLRASDVFVSAALSEGLPNSVLEAMACGLPACLSSIEPHKEILAEVPKGAVLFKPGSASDLAQGLFEIITGDLSSMSKASVEGIRRRFGADAMARAYEQVYASMKGVGRS